MTKKFINGIEVGRAALLATGQSTIYAIGDDADVLAGLPKPTARYQVNTTGPWLNTTPVYLPTGAWTDLIFTVAGRTITSVAGGFSALLKTNDRIRIRGSALNNTSAAADGCYLITVTNDNTLTCDAATPPIANETCLTYITLAKQALVSNNVVVDLNTSRADKPPVTWLRYGTYSPAKLGAASDGKLFWTATAVSIHAAANDIYIVSGGKGIATVHIKGGAAEIAKYWPGYSYSFGFVGAIAKLPGMRCTAVATSGVALADLSITVATGNQTCTSEGSDATPVNGAISLECNGIFGYANACIAAGVGGYSDWRVPNKTEFESLLDYEQPTSLPDITAFPSVPAGSLWSSTTVTVTALDAYAPHASYGYIAWDQAKTTAFYAMLLRGGG